MDKNKKVNWLDIILNSEFQCLIQFKTLKEVSMLSKLTREKLKPTLFNNLKLKLDNIKFESNVFSIAYDYRILFSIYDYSTLKEENNGRVEEFLTDFIYALQGIKKFAKSFFLSFTSKPGYYLFSIVKVFDNLTNLKINDSKIPFDALVNIGKTLPNLKALILEDIDLVKSNRDNISAMDIVFPPNLGYLKLFRIYVITTSLLSDPYEYLFNSEVNYSTYEYFILPKLSIPSLKRFDFRPKEEEDSGVEHFLEINPNLESLLTRGYDLKLCNSIISLKSLDIDEFSNINNIDQIPKLTSINSLALITTDFNYSEDIRTFCHICPNLVNLSLDFYGKTPHFQPIIDSYLAPALQNLTNLKSLVLKNVPIHGNGHILDFSKFAQIKKLKIILLYGSILNIKFNGCKSLKLIEFLSYDDYFNDEFKRKFDHYDNWVFKFCGFTIKGYKI